MIYLGADKHGFKVIKMVKDWLDKKGKEYKNLGVEKQDEDVKLENLLPKVAENVRKDSNNLAVISCGSGIGVEVGINKFSRVRGCLAYDPEIAKWSRVYDNCNVLCLVGWRLDKELIRSILKQWFSARYDGSKKRLKMLKEFDNWH
jgi:ribose 5-phosphate isomerase B